MKRWQRGQSMAEYVIVCAGLISALYFVGDVECGSGSQTTKCVSKLLKTIHDGYDGYSSSMSSVQKYGDYKASGTPSDGFGNGNGGGSNNGGGGSVGGLNPDGLTEVTQITSANGLATYGTLLPDGTVVNANGEVVGFYDDSDNLLTLNNGSQVAAVSNDIVVDEQGNVLHLRAITSCVPTLPNQPKPVYSWGYVSKATGKVFNSLNKNEMDIGGLCSEPSFKVVKNGQAQAGRILNSEYYAAIFATDVSNTPLPSTGEVVYWQELGICSVMVTDWDSDLDPDNDKTDEELYIAQIEAFTDNDRNLGEIDKIDYFNQTSLYGVPTEPNDCPTNKIISQP